MFIQFKRENLMSGRVGRTGHHFSPLALGLKTWMDDLMKSSKAGGSVGATDLSRTRSTSLHSHTLITNLGHAIPRSCPNDPELRSESACGPQWGEECENSSRCMWRRHGGVLRWRFTIDWFKIRLVKIKNPQKTPISTVESSFHYCPSVNITSWTTGSSKW